MTNDLTNTSPQQKQPAIQTRAAADLQAVYRSRLLRTPAGGWSISDRDAPQGRDLETLTERRTHLRSFTPADRTSIGARVARMFLRFPNTAAKGSPDMVAAYTMDLERFPLWAIDRGIASIIHGHALKSTEYAPSSLDVQKAVRDAMAPVQDELTALTEILDAKVYVDPGEDERKRVSGKFDALLGEMKKTNGFDAPRRPKDARDTAAAPIPSPGCMVDASIRLSPSALATLPDHLRPRDSEAAA